MLFSEAITRNLFNRHVPNETKYDNKKYDNKKKKEKKIGTLTILRFKCLHGFENFHCSAALKSAAARVLFRCCPFVFWFLCYSVKNLPVKRGAVAH